MKKMIALALTLCLAVAALAGCSSSNSPSYDINAIMTAIEEVAPVTMSGEMDDEYLTAMYGIDLANVEEYVGKYSLVNVSSDEILIVKATKGKADAIKTACETRRDAKASGCEMYLPSEYEKATAGRIVVKGDYVIFVIAGDSAAIEDKGIEAVYAPIDEAIDTATK